MASSSMESMESYSKILATLILENVLGFLEINDQLSARLVNKDFADAAKRPLRHSDLEIDLQGHRLDGFIVTFLHPVRRPNPLLRDAVVTILIGSNSQDSLAVLGQNFGSDIRHLSFYLPQDLTKPHPVLNSRIKSLLNLCSNLTKLTIEHEYSHHTKRNLPRFCMCNRNCEIPNFPYPGQEVTEVMSLVYLREATFEMPLACLNFVYDIVQAAQNITTLALKILCPSRGDARDDYVIAPECTARFFEKVKSIPKVKLDVPLYLPDSQGVNTVFNTLTSSDLYPQELTLRFLEEGHAIQTDKILIRDWLIKIASGSTLKKLTMRSNNLHGFEIQLPAQMSHLEILDIGKWGIWDRGSRCPCYGHINPTEQISPEQIPLVHTVYVKVITAKSLIDTGVFRAVTKLVVRATDDLPSQEFLAPPSAPWPKMFPNLTSLHTAVVVPVGGGESLRPIFCDMPNLVHLTLEFVWNWDSNPINFGENLWDVFTGSLRPVMNCDTSLDTIIPPISPLADDVSSQSASPSVTDESSQFLTQAVSQSNSNYTQLEIDDRQRSSISAIYNLKVLRKLSLNLPPVSVFLAIVHFTATEKIVALDELKIRLNSDIFGYVVDFDQYRDRYNLIQRAKHCLSNYHKFVVARNPMSLDNDILF